MGSILLQMDEKEKQILKRYKTLIEMSTFDEYDILGFLIFIRRHLNNGEHPNILEFADLVAHRGRDRGRVNDCIVTAIKNNYATKQDGKTVLGYNGMKYDKWVKEWKNIADRLEIIINKKIIEELTLCIFSLAQFSQYNDKDNNGSGRMELFFSKNGSLCLSTTEGNRDSLYVCYAMFGSFKLCREIAIGYLKNPVETVRENGKLRLRDKDGYII